MAWTAPRTWTNGEIPTDTMFNVHLRDNLISLRPHTTRGDLAYLNNAGALVRLALGAETLCLKSYNNDPTYVGAIGFHMYNNAAVSISNNTVTQLSFNKTRFNGFALCSSTTLTVPTGWTGLWLIGAGGYFDGHGTDDTLRQIGLDTDSTNDNQTASFVQDADAQPTWVNVVMVRYLAAGKTCTVKVLQRSGSSLNFNYANFWGCKLA